MPDFVPRFAVILCIPGVCELRSSPIEAIITTSTSTSLLPRRSELPTLAGKPGEFVRRYRWPLVILLVGATADAVTTLINLQRFGLEIEVHLVQRWVSHLVGITAGVPIAKFLQLVFVILVSAWWRPWCAILLTLCGVLYAAAAISNHFLLL